MTIGLDNAGRRFESMMTTVGGFPFVGDVQAMDEGKVPSYDYSDPRLILRVRHLCPVNTGSMIIDPAGRRFLLANHDAPSDYNQVHYRTHRLFHMATSVLWEREVQELDTLTKLQKGIGRQALANIWVLIERVTREPPGGQMGVKEQVRQVITNEDIQLGDIIDKMVVKRLDTVLGVNLAEIQ
ncbi:hypothetical protein [Mesorhizobium sp. STM 4661]|uniref:hypothetical protein n=1 Tax=Mesorhizobium sp. STM 4661 TaxID=1297570 RepID=UPI0002BE2F2F|nr:hypothetical protein [Mesorhizobium sp. STM 4661]CCV12939.1 hypothetical protein MESS4_510106 [Mesorhizobium sp. STM 4661]